MQPFPKEIAQFVKENIDSAAQLEILRILAADPTKEWCSDVLANAVQTTPQLLQRHLQALCKRGLLTVSDCTTSGYRHGCRSPELEEKTRLLLQLYNERPVTLIRLVSARR